MLGWTTRHCRYFHRLLSPNVCLYTEMIPTKSLLYGNIEDQLAFHPKEQPLVLQLGGGDALELAKCAILAKQYGFKEINLNCGCPSPKVKQGMFGACLMMQPFHVCECWRMMHEKSMLITSIKHRIGVDYFDDYDFLFEFVSCLYRAGCRDFIIHARKALLNGLSPKKNREIPPLRYHYVYQIKKDFPDCRIIINGGIQNASQVLEHLKYVDGVMIGRAAYHYPLLMLKIDKILFSSLKMDHETVLKTEEEERKILINYLSYIDNQLVLGEKISQLISPMLGWRRGDPGSKLFRHLLSKIIVTHQTDIKLLENILYQFNFI